MTRGVVILALFLSGCLFSSSSVDETKSDMGEDAGRDVGADAASDDTGAGDGVVEETCGDGLLQPNEACDFMLPANSPGSCPESCDDGQACTIDELVGSADTCDATCRVTVIEACQNNDGCCPSTCTPANDTDCDDSAVCGDGTLAEAELCDPGISSGPGSCPTIDDCTTTDACAVPRVAGSFSNCDAECIEIAIESCTDGDGCCPTGCGSTNDDDCTAECGNNRVDPGELCDGDCPEDPTDCDDQNPCTDDMLEGTAGTCDARCVHMPVSACMNNDQCCPSACDPSNDNDCSLTCGDGVVDPPLETCEDTSPTPGEECPTTCDDMDACTTDISTGSAANCNRVCVNNSIASCISADDCCPGNGFDACNATNDSDCDPVCGNDVVESGEACDGNCPTTCDDGVACTTDVLVGMATDCSASCTNTPITSCTHGDGCCPPGCTSTNDDDCGAVCGNGIVEEGESCDGNCPQNCDDGNACTTGIVMGSAAQCTRTCAHAAVIACIHDDGCCPSNCTSGNDNDCSPTCGNGVVDAGETCDGDCLSIEDCQAQGPCRVRTGSENQCNVVCEDAVDCVECDRSSGDCQCDDGEICDESGKCALSFNGDDCARACRPDAYCEVFTPGSQCFEQTSQCGECLNKNQCAFDEECVANFCEYADNCDDARSPSSYCAALGYPACNMQTGDCWDACQFATDCGLTETCVAGFCMEAQACDEANNGDEWCAQLDESLICIGDQCRNTCSPLIQNCDCPEPALQRCVEDANSGKNYCSGPPPLTCQQVCLGFRDEYCENRKPGSFCGVPHPGAPDGCIFIGDDMGPPDMGNDMGPPDMGGDMGSETDSGSSDLGIPFD